MPRIAVAIMVVLTIGVSIGVNTAQFPVVRKMLNRSAGNAASQAASRAPLAAEPAESSREDVDLSQFAPPTIQAASSDVPTLPEATPSPTSETNGSGTADLHTSVNPSSDASPGGGAMHLVSQQPPIDGQSIVSKSLGTSSVLLGEEQDAARGPAPGFLAGDPGAAGALFPEPARPIAFGPAATPIGSTLPAGRFSSRNVENAAPYDASESTTWPAEMAPTLKLAAKPVIAGGDDGDWREQRPLVPLRRPSDQVSATPVSTSRSGLSIERLPEVLATEPAPPWKDLVRSREISEAIYPSTGQ
ncbi:MAG: hypothetical protein JW719_06110 [Pirellulales bacterium]|nr:hypothetical protein [Pirellulales bacterium]